MKELRERAGLSKSAVAREIGTTVSTVAKYEAGSVLPTTYPAWRMAKLYGVTIEELMGYDQRGGTGDEQNL